MGRNQVILHRQLFKAVARNDLRDIQRLIDFGADVNSEFTINELINNKLIDDNAVTIIKNAKTTIHKLVNDKSLDHNTITTIKNSSFSQLIFLPVLMNKIILSMESKLSPLQLAVMYGWKEIIIKLIKKGANPNKALDIQGITILQLMCTAAVFRDKQHYIFDEEIVQLLFDHGANPNIQDINGRTFLHYAVISSDFHVDEMIRKFKSNNDSNISDHRDIRRIANFLINGANPNIKNSYNHCTILYDIVEHDSYLEEQPNLTNLLLDHGCTYSTYEDVLKQPEIISMMKEDYGRNYGFADAKKQVDTFNSKHKQYVEKNNCLIKAIKNKEKSKVSILLDEGTSPNVRDVDGLSALHLAVKLGNYAITNLLLDKGANPNIKTWKNGTTPLFNAVISNRADIVDLLFEHAANPSILNTNGISPLYFSITDNNEEMAKLLLRYNANPDISCQISILFNFLDGIKDDRNIEIIENTLRKIKYISEFLKSEEISVDYSLFYQSIYIAEENGKKNIAKRVTELLDELTYSVFQ